MALQQSIITEPKALNVVDRCIGIKNQFPTGYPSFGVKIRGKPLKSTDPSTDVTVNDSSLTNVSSNTSNTDVGTQSNSQSTTGFISNIEALKIIDSVLNTSLTKKPKSLNRIQRAAGELANNDSQNRDSDGMLSGLDDSGYPPNDVSITYAFGTGLTVNSEEPKDVTSITVSRYDINGDDVIEKLRLWLFYANIEVTFFLDSETGSASYLAPSVANAGNMDGQSKGFDDNASNFSYVVSYIDHEGDVFATPITITYHYRVLWCNGGKRKKKEEPEEPIPVPVDPDDPKSIKGDVLLEDLIPFLLVAIQNLKCRVEFLEAGNPCQNPTQCTLLCKGVSPGPILPRFGLDDHLRSDELGHYD